jgi:hypothetical protein
MGSRTGLTSWLLRLRHTLVIALISLAPDFITAPVLDTGNFTAVSLSVELSVWKSGSASNGCSSLLSAKWQRVTDHFYRNGGYTWMRRDN